MEMMEEQDAWTREAYRLVSIEDRFPHGRSFRDGRCGGPTRTAQQEGVNE